MKFSDKDCWIMSGTLYIVGTPIGNLGDFSPRAVETLSSVDFIAAEDTRVTLKLLNHFGIKKPLISYFEHNKRFRGEEILKRLEGGENCALVTDAGMPAISDPGEDIVALCVGRSIKVVAVPGPCAAVTALALSGLPTGRFCFEGFLSVNKKSRRDHLLSLKTEPRTMIFYEAPHKLLATLKDMAENFGDRRISLVREITKIHEEVIATTLRDAVSIFTEREPKGEFVLIVDGYQEEIVEQSEDERMEQALKLVAGYIDEGLSHNEAVKKASKEAGVPRSTLYKQSLDNE